MLGMANQAAMMQMVQADYNMAQSMMATRRAMAMRMNYGCAGMMGSYCGAFPAMPMNIPMPGPMNLGFMNPMYSPMSMTGMGNGFYGGYQMCMPHYRPNPYMGVRPYYQDLACGCYGQNQGVYGARGAGAVSSKPTRYDGIIREACMKYGVEESFVKAVIQQESRFNANARSGAGAIGLMQLMPATARGLGVTNPWDPRQNIMGGVKYLSQNLRRFNGNKSLALAAYNAGPGAVKKHGGIPPYRETQNYVRKIMNNYNQMNGYA